MGFYVIASREFANIFNEDGRERESKLERSIVSIVSWAGVTLIFIPL